MLSIRCIACTIALAYATATAASTQAALRCGAKSGATRVAVLELYTSEGCDSCPSADRWLSALPASGLGHDKVVPLALHVDYWNYLGWTDRFAQPRFTQRQRAAAQRNRSSFVYTPQRLLNGKDFRPAMQSDDTAKRIAEINRGKPGADIDIGMSRQSARIEVDLTVSYSPATAPHGADLYLALVEHDLTTAVKAGENKGKHLRHDFVVRRLLGPLPLDGGQPHRWQRTIDLPAEWRPEKLSVAAFVELRGSGDVLQALALPLCS